MPARRPSLVNAGIDLGFVVLAFVLGLERAPLWAALLAALAMIGYWGWSRRTALNAMSVAQKMIQAAISIAIMLAVLAGAYFLGHAFDGAKA